MGMIKKLMHTLPALLACVIALGAVSASAAEPELESTAELAPVMYLETAGGFVAKKMDVGTVTVRIIDNIVYYSATDIARISGEGDMEEWTTGEAVAFMRYNRRTQRAEKMNVLKLSMDNGERRYDVTTSAVALVIDDNTVSSLFTSDTDSENGCIFEIDGEVYMTAHGVNCLFYRTKIVDKKIMMEVPGEQPLSILRGVKDTGAKNTLKAALWLLFVLDHDSYEYTLGNVSGFALSSQETANRACRSDGVMAFVWEGSAIVNWVSDFLTPTQIFEIAVMMPHEATHAAERSTCETNAVVNEIKCRLNLGYSLESTQQRIDFLSCISKYERGAKKAQALIDAATQDSAILPPEAARGAGDEPRSLTDCRVEHVSSFTQVRDGNTIISNIKLCFVERVSNKV